MVIMTRMKRILMVYDDDGDDDDGSDDVGSDDGSDGW